MVYKFTWVLVGAVVVALTGGGAALSPAQAGILEVIYYDDFSGHLPGTNLHGTAPDTRPGSETWTAHTDWKADGSKVGTTDDRNAFLPFEPEAGAIYRLSMDLNPTAGSDNSDWFALGFTPSDGITTQFSHNDPAPWALLRVGRTHEAAGHPSLYSGPGPGSNVLEPHSEVDSDRWADFVNLAIELDTRETQ